MTQEAIKYLEEQAGKTMEFHFKNMECLNQAAEKTLSVLFGMISATFAGAAHLIGVKNSYGLGFSLVALCICLMWLAFRLTDGCLNSPLKNAKSHC